MNILDRIEEATASRPLGSGSTDRLLHKEPMPGQMQPQFTLTFSLGTPMHKIRDTVIQTVLQHTRGHRLRTARILGINPRTIRRRMGRKQAAAAATRAA